MPETTAPTIPLDDGTGRSVRKTEEALSGGYTGLASVSQVLGRYNDDAARRYGDRVWDRVRRDPAAGGSVDVLVYTALANDLEVVPSVTLEPGKGPANAAEQAELDLSNEVAAWVAKNLKNLERPFHDVAREQVTCALEYGADVADLVWEVREGGEDAGHLVLKAIKPKARRSWAFEVDPYWNLKYVIGASGNGLGWQRWPREKFAVMTWGGRGGDPRGESAYARAVEAWNFRVQIPEDHFRFLKRFGTPKVVGRFTPTSRAAGEPGSGGILGAGAAGLGRGLQSCLNKLLAFINQDVLAVDIGDDIKLHEVQGEGQAFAAAMDLYGREIVRAVLLQVRATVEAKHGSKADSESSGDVLGNMIRYLRRWVCRAYEWDVFNKIVAYRYGPEVARRHTPSASLGDVEHQDVAALLSALGSVGYTVQPSQFPGIDEYTGVVPVRTANEVTKEAESAAAKAPPPAGNPPPNNQPPPGQARSPLVVPRGGVRRRAA